MRANSADSAAVLLVIDYQPIWRMRSMIRPL
jgi:hypothetical protein